MSPVKWIEQNLIFLPLSGPGLKGAPVGRFILPFQRKIIRSALTDKGEPNKNVFLGFSRKISKSMIYSWLFNFLLETKEGMNLVTMASTFNQSNVIYHLIREQIRLNPNINEADYKVTEKYLVNQKKSNTLYKIFSKAESNLGMLNVSAVIADEIGAMQSRSNLDAILSGLSMAQTKPLLLFASNPPELFSHWSNEYLKTLKTDKDWDFYDFSAPMKADPYTKAAKSAANPFYAHYLKTKVPLLKSLYDFIEKESEKARFSSEALNIYRRFQLGQRVSAKAYLWVDIKDIQIAPLTILKDKSLRAVLGFDLALSRDFCACVLCLFNETTEDIYVRPFLHLANLNDRRPSQKQQFTKWNQSGFIRIQEREAIDKSLFCDEIKAFLSEHGITPEISVWDRNLSTGWTEEFPPSLLYKGTAAEMSHSIRFIEARSREKKLHFIGENPALMEMFDSVICSQKSKGFTLLDRTTSRHSIDGAVATTLCVKFFIENRRQAFFGVAIP